MAWLLTDKFTLDCLLGICKILLQPNQLLSSNLSSSCKTSFVNCCNLFFLSKYVMPRNKKFINQSINKLFWSILITLTVTDVNYPTFFNVFNTTDNLWPYYNLYSCKSFLILWLIFPWIIIPNYNSILLPHNISCR